MIKAIFFDIDGTLLSYQSRQVPNSTKQALRQLKEKGILTFIATGRHVSEMKDLPIGDLEFEGYITLNGQYCFNDQGIIYHLPIDKQDIDNILSRIDHDRFPCIFVEKELMYINYNNEDVAKVQKYIATALPDINDLHRGLTEPIYQVIPYGIKKELEQEILELMPNCKATRWHPLAIDIIPSNGGKQNGIKEVLKYYHIDINETMSFGDGENDLDMFDLTSISIAMGNASDIVKSKADYVTDDVDHDGIYHALKHYHIL